MADLVKENFYDVLGVEESADKKQSHHHHGHPVFLPPPSGYSSMMPYSTLDLGCSGHYRPSGYHHQSMLPQTAHPWSMYQAAQPPPLLQDRPTMLPSLGVQTSMTPESGHSNASIVSPVSIEGSSTVSASSKRSDKSKNYECQVCNKRLSTMESLDSHMRLHTGDKPMKCHLCGKGFANDTYLKQHVKYHTTAKPYVCLICDVAYKHNCSLKRHMEENHQENATWFKCSYCDKKFRRTANLQVHERTHTGEKPYKCEHCDRCFRQIGQLIVHRRDHTGDRPYVCKYCKKTFKGRTNLVEHQRTHTGEKPYKCTMCTKSFISSGKLCEHKKTHTMPFKCVWCKKIFGSSRSFKFHKMIHTGEKPHKCSKCDKTFIRATECRKHERRHDNGKKMGRPRIRPEGEARRRNRSKTTSRKRKTQTKKAERKTRRRKCKVPKKTVYDEDTEIDSDNEDNSTPVIEKPNVVESEGEVDNGVTEVAAVEPDIVARTASHETIAVAQIPAEEIRQAPIPSEQRSSCAVIDPSMPSTSSQFSHQPWINVDSPNMASQNVQMPYSHDPIVPPLIYHENGVVQSDYNSLWCSINQVFSHENQQFGSNNQNHDHSPALSAGNRLNNFQETFSQFSQGTMTRPAKTQDCQSSLQTPSYENNAIPSSEHSYIGPQQVNLPTSTPQTTLTSGISEPRAAPASNVNSKGFSPNLSAKTTTVGPKQYPQEITTFTDGSMRCPQCGRLCMDQQRFEAHMKLHNAEKPYSCHICQKRFTTVGYLKQHVKYHTNLKPYNCELCDVAYKHKCSLKRHMESHMDQSTRDQVKCRYCPKIFFRTEHLKVHERIHTGDKPFMCTVCGEFFISSSARFLHHKTQHFNSYPHFCDTCGRSFKGNHELKNHKITHLPVKPFKCPHCPKRFCSMSKVRMHTNIHKKLYVCETCKKACPTPRELRLHEETHAKNMVSCDLCKKTFASKKGVASHMNNGRCVGISGPKPPKKRAFKRRVRRKKNQEKTGDSQSPSSAKDSEQELRSNDPLENSESMSKNRSESSRRKSKLKPKRTIAESSICDSDSETEYFSNMKTNPIKNRTVVISDLMKIKPGVIRYECSEDEIDIPDENSGVGSNIENDGNLKEDEVENENGDYIVPDDEEN